MDFKEIIGESAEDLYENAPCGYVSTLPDGTIVKINQTLLAWIGYSREEVLGLKKLQGFFSIGGRIFYETHHAPLLQMQGGVSELSYDLTRKDGVAFPALINSIQIKDASGKPLLTRSTVLNITERKKYEKELLHAKKKAEKATEAKAAFLSTISHEIRTPLNAVIGITHLLLDASPRPDQANLLNMLKFSSGHLLNLINDVLDFSKIESGRIALEEKEFNVRGLLSGILGSLGVKAEEKGLSMQVHVDDRLPACLVGDPVKISQVLTNLIGNAIKFTHSGSVTVSLVAAEIADGAILIEFSVTDTGIGIPREKHEQIFEEFAQAGYAINQTYGGSGLGLAICRKLLELYGSRLTLKSEPGKGSRFSFSLSLRPGQEPAQGALPEGPADTSRSLAGVRVLVAEDNRVNRYIVSQFLEKWGARYDAVESGAEAVAHISRNDYHVVLMDLQMPGMDGYEAAIRVRSLPGEKYRQLPIIAFSASGKNAMEESPEAAGINDFVSKPFQPHELFAKLAAYADQGINPLPSELPFDLRGCVALTENNREDLAHLVQISLEELNNYKGVFRNSLSTGDAALLERIAHKSIATRNLLDTKKLNALIGQAQMQLQEESNQTRLQELMAAIEAELNAIITGLQRFSSREE